MGSGIKDELLARARPRTREVELDGGLVLTIRELTASEGKQFAAYATAGDHIRARAYVLGVSIINGNGGPMLTEEEAAELAESNRASNPIQDAIFELSGFNTKDGAADPPS